MNPLTDKEQAQQVAAAELLGWKPVHDKLNGNYCWREPKSKWYKKWFEICHTDACDIEALPNFHTDANASLQLIEWMAKKDFRFKSNCGTGFTFEAQFWRKIRDRELVDEDHVAIIDGERCIEPYGCADTFQLSILHAFLRANGREDLI